jgi:hypothetical protein
MMGRNSSTTIATTMMHRSLRDRKIKRKVVWKLEYFKERGDVHFFHAFFVIRFGVEEESYEFVLLTNWIESGFHCRSAAISLSSS